MNIKFLILVVLTFCFLNDVSSQEKLKQLSNSPLSIGEKVEVHSKILGEDRLLNIYLPNGYSPDSTKTYPVIYLLDGSIDEDFIHIAGLVQFASFSWINIIPESIVVGIANVDRRRDFTFPSNNKEDNQHAPTSGKSDNFMDFIEKELKPFIDQAYKQNGKNVLIGQSLGGLMATQILFERPDMFTDYIIVSPSLWWDDVSIAAYEPKSYSSEKSIFVGVGKEGYGMEELAEGLYDKLMLLRKDNTRINFKYFEEQDHGDVLHLAVYEAFEKLYVEEEGTVEEKK